MHPAVERMTADALERLAAGENKGAGRAARDRGILADACARYMGQTARDFIAEAIDAAIAGTLEAAQIETGGDFDIPLTRQERAALSMPPTKWYAMRTA